MEDIIKHLTMARDLLSDKIDERFDEFDSCPNHWKISANGHLFSKATDELCNLQGKINWTIQRAKRYS